MNAIKTEKITTIPQIDEKEIIADVYEHFAPKQGAGILAHKDVLGEILSAIEPVNFKALPELEELEKIQQKHLIVLFIKRLLETVKKHNFDFARKHEFIFVYNGAFWKELNRPTIKNALGKYAAKMGIEPLEARHYEFREKLYKQFVSDAHFERLDDEKESVLINLKNGTFEITSNNQKLREFQSADFLTYQLPFEYDKNAKCPIFLEYLDKVLPEVELQNIVAEFFGYVFTKQLKLEKALLLYGSGANGKSVLFDIMNAVLGKENVTNMSLSNLLEEHNRAMLANKLLNYGSEINASITRDIFKNLVSTEPIQARMKYGNSFLMENYAKICFNCNELPRDIEQTNAYFRRLLIVPFRVTITENDQDKELAQKIIKNELSGVFNWILEGLRRLLKNKNFTQSEIVKNEIETYRKESDSVAFFIEELDYQKVADRKEATLLRSIYGTYKSFCSDYGFHAVSSSNLRKRLNGLGFESEKINKGVVVYAKLVGRGFDELMKSVSRDAEPKINF